MPQPSSHVHRIVVDLSGDGVTQLGALEAIAELSFKRDCMFRVLGDVQALSYALAALPFEAEFIETVHVADTARALEYAAETLGSAQNAGFVSGTSARTVISAFSRLQSMLPGVSTPALATIIPVVKGIGPEATDRYSVLLDASGQNWAEPTRADVLIALAAPLVRWFTTRDPLRVGVLVSDTQPGVQDAATQLLLAQLAAISVGIDNLGALTPADVMLGAADIVLSNGPNGAMFARTLEATFIAAEALVHRETQGVRGRLGFRMFRDRLEKLRDYGNSESYGGAALVGAQGPVVLLRPDASMRAWVNAIRMARKMGTESILEAQRAALHLRDQHDRA